MRASRSQSRRLIGAIAALAVCSAAYAYLYSETGRLTDGAIGSRLAMRDAATARLQGTDLKELQASSAADRIALRALFVPSESAVSLIQTIESVGRQSGASVAISSIGASDPDPSTRIGSISASIAIHGSWAQVMKVLALFESLPYDRAIDQVVLRGGGGKDAQWQADIKLAVGTLAAPAPQASPSQPGS